MAEDHKTVLLSIAATVSAAIIVLLGTVAVNGGFSLDLARQYVLPLFITALTLGIFWAILFSWQKRTKPLPVAA